MPIVKKLLVHVALVSIAVLCCTFSLPQASRAQGNFTSPGGGPVTVYTGSFVITATQAAQQGIVANEWNIYLYNQNVDNGLINYPGTHGWEVLCSTTPGGNAYSNFQVQVVVPSGVPSPGYTPFYVNVYGGADDGIAGDLRSWQGSFVIVPGRSAGPATMKLQPASYTEMRNALAPALQSITLM